MRGTFLSLEIPGKFWSLGRKQHGSSPGQPFSLKHCLHCCLGCSTNIIVKWLVTGIGPFKNLNGSWVGGSLLMTTVLQMTLKRMREMMRNMYRRGPPQATRNHLARCFSTNIISLITTVKYSVVLETQKSSFRCSENRTVETSESQS